MANIAILASAEGLQALHITEFFSEGNRLNVACLLTDNNDATIAAALTPHGVETLFFPAEVWTAAPDTIVRFLRNRNIDLIVIDDFARTVPSEIINAFPDKVLRIENYSDSPAVVALSPGSQRIVMEANPEDAENLWPRAIVAAINGDSSQPTPTPADNSRFPPTPESEWAESLHVPYTPAPTPPPVLSPEDNGAPSISPSAAPYPIPTYPAASPVNPCPPQPPVPPMPPTNVLWAILSLVLCCTPLGIVALVFAARVSSLYYAGKYDEAAKSSRNAEYWIIASIVLGLISMTFSLPLSLMGF
ncbi:MAG: CD225/dispanin family protein [Muribaculum sp.]|nr:CD225/dispanin family protein [Muribaculum sp.]